jgi:hypothetical protein
VIKGDSIMTLEEKLRVSNKAIALKKAGDREGYERLMKTIPVPPFIVKVIKEKLGVEFILKDEWNLSEAEAEFGSDYLSK